MENFICIDRVAFTLFGRDIYWYGLLMCLCIVAAIVVAIFFCKKRGLSIDVPINIALIAVPAGILGGRLFAVLFDSDLSIADYLKFRDGGMSIMGCIVGASIALAVYTFIKVKQDKSKDIFLYFDVICSVLLLAQAIGRWGNFFNAELYGQPIAHGSLFARFPFAVMVNGQYYQALFLYECILNLIGFIFTAQFFLQVKKDGYTTGFYLIYYGAVRTYLERLRQPEFVLRLGGLPFSMICSIAMIVIGITVLVIAVMRNKKRKEAER